MTDSDPIISYAIYAICIIALLGDLGSVYFAVHIWSYRKHKFIQSRSPTLTYSVLWIFFSLLILAIINTLLYILVKFWTVTYFIIVEDFIQYGCTFAYATRAWILFYHVEWSYETLNDIWRTQMVEVAENVSEEALRSTTLDVTSSSEEDMKLLQRSQFYINYRESLGNWKKVFPITMCLIFPVFIFLLDILPLIIFDIKSEDNNNNNNIILRVIQILCYLIIFCIIFYLIHHIHKISDKYGIGKELFHINICFACFILIGRIINEILFVFKQYQFIVFIASLCSMFSILLSLYIGSFFVLRHLFQEFAGRDTLKDFEKRETLKKVVTICTKKTFQKHSSQKKEIEQHPLTLNRVLSSKIGFETFTQFLISELSVENILFLVEVKQYKACCRRYHKRESGKTTPIAFGGKTKAFLPLNGNNKNSLAPSTAKFNPATVASLRPTTTTRSKPNVFKSKSIMNVAYVPSNAALQLLDPYDYATYLYYKYVIDGSDLQINIPSKTKKILTKFLIKTNKSDIILLDDYTDQMFKLYDKAWEQIHGLIDKDSYSRFKNTKEYEEIWLRAKQDDENKHNQKKNNKNNNNNDDNDDFLNKPEQPSLLNWESNEMVMLSDVGSGHTSIPEEAEIDGNGDEEKEEEEEEEEYEDALRKLNTIGDYNKYNDNHNNNDHVDMTDDDAMDLLNDIADYNSADKEKQDDDDEHDK